jgi:2',3'-cyclic-nucleotide 2'-phosphodiesterase (5'-nucleotidase family)
MFIRPFLGLLVAGHVLACGDHDDHVHTRRMQPDATPSKAWPTVPLEWGDINVIHTTDTHGLLFLFTHLILVLSNTRNLLGWLLGHLHASQPEPSYSGDLGDLASFIEHMKAEADKKGVDLLVVDSGDLHDGNGLSDGYPVGGVDGQKVCL